MNGNGKSDVNSGNQFATGGLHMNWHYLYYGYSRIERKAHGYIKYTSDEKTITYADTNHYLAEKFYLLLRDERYPSYIGQ